MAPALDAEIADVLRVFPEIAAGWIFGSESRGQARPESDLDVALLLRDRSQTAVDAYLLLGRIGANLERVVPGRRADVVLIQFQGPVFQHRVLSEGRLVLDADPKRRVDFESDAYVRYFDFFPTHELARRHALSGFRDWFRARA